MMTSAHLLKPRGDGRFSFNFFLSFSLPTGYAVVVEVPPCKYERLGESLIGIFGHEISFAVKERS